MQRPSPLHTRPDPEQQPQPPFAGPQGPPAMAHEQASVPPSLCCGCHIQLAK
jgi:hypothetical protein